MVINAATAEAEFRCAPHEVREIRHRGRRIREEQLPVENLGKQFVEPDANVLSAKRQSMRALYPAQVLDEVEIILCLRPVGLRSRSKLKSGGRKSELINTAGQITRRPVNPRVSSRDRVHIGCA